MQTELLSLITQQPVQKADIVCCPYCQSILFQLLESQSTLLGYARCADPNHYTYTYRCSSCEKRFHVNVKRPNMWITDTTGRVIKGVSDCWENVIYTCAECGGDVVRSYLNLDGTTRNPNTGLNYHLTDKSIVADFQTKWECVVCLKSCITSVGMWFV